MMPYDDCVRTEWCDICHREWSTEGYYRDDSGICPDCAYDLQESAIPKEEEEV